MILKINDNTTKLDFDICNPDELEAYEKALNEVIKKTTFNEKDKISASQKVRIQCSAVFEFFDSLFGEGIHKQIFGERVNLRDCLMALNQIVDDANRQDQEIKNLTNRYTPNRAQRRHHKKNGRV